MAETSRKNGTDFNIVRLDLYPIHEPESRACRDLVARCRAELEATGCCSLPDFLTPDGLKEMTALSGQAARAAYIAPIRTNVYFTKDDEALPADHPKRRFMERTSAFVPAEAFPWHFDTNDFSVSILTQAAEQAGLFEFAPNVRSPADENYAGVRRVLDGERSAVLSLDLEPGDLQIFKGRNSLHRVTEVGGTRPRYTAIFSNTKGHGYSPV